jgi:hypothetical protein
MTYFLSYVFRLCILNRNLHNHRRLHFIMSLGYVLWMTSLVNEHVQAVLCKQTDTSISLIAVCKFSFCNTVRLSKTQGASRATYSAAPASVTLRNRMEPSPGRSSTLRQSA